MQGLPVEATGSTNRPGSFQLAKNPPGALESEREPLQVVVLRQSDRVCSDAQAERHTGHYASSVAAS